MNEYGHFSKDGSRFIITNPNTPRPWINYLTNEDYCAIISQCAGGYSFYKDCRGNRILRWKPGNWHFDRPGRYIFVKDRKAQNIPPAQIASQLSAESNWPRREIYQLLINME